MSDTMKAAVFNEYGDPDTVKVEEIDKPQAGEGEVLIQVRSAGVNPVDTAVVKGMLDGAIETKFPAVPGWDVAGVVVDRGHGARRFKEGDKVYAYARRPIIQYGTFAEFISLPESYVAKAPEKLSIEQAGGIPLVGLTAYQSLFDAGQLKEDQTVLILGASGGVGSIAIQLARNAGAEVIGVASSSNHEYMESLGADHTIDYADNHVGEAVKKIKPEGVDLIFHCSRGNALDQVMEADILKSDGRLISITKSQPDISDDIYFEYVFVEPNAEQLGRLQAFADSGKLSITLSKTYSLNEVSEALKAISTLHTKGKIVITP